MPIEILTFMYKCHICGMTEEVKQVGGNQVMPKGWTLEKVDKKKPSLETCHECSKKRKAKHG